MKLNYEKLNYAMVKDQYSPSLHLIMAYFIFVTTIFRLIIFKLYDFFLLFENQ